MSRAMCAYSRAPAKAFIDAPIHTMSSEGPAILWEGMVGVRSGQEG